MAAAPDAPIQLSVEESKSNPQNLQNLQDFVVTNVDQGNTVAGNLLKDLIAEVKLFSGQMTEISKKVNSLLSRLEKLEANEATLYNEATIMKIKEEFQELVSDNNAKQKKRIDILYEKMDSLEIDTQDKDAQSNTIDEMKKLFEQKLADQQKMFEIKLIKQKESIIEQLSSKDNSKTENESTGGDLATQITTLISRIDTTINSMVIPRQYIERRKSESRLKRLSRPLSTSFDQVETPNLGPRTTSVSSTTSAATSGYASNRNSQAIFSIDENSFNSSGIPTDQIDTSTPIENMIDDKNIQRNVAYVFHRMVDLLESLRELIAVTSENT